MSKVNIAGVEIELYSYKEDEAPILNYLWCGPNGYTYEWSMLRKVEKVWPNGFSGRRWKSIFTYLDVFRYRIVLHVKWGFNNICPIEAKHLYHKERKERLTNV